MNWYAIYTKPKAEDSTARLLNNAGVETLNPKIRTKKFVRKKYTESIEQLFPCSIFALFDPGKLGHMITYTRGVRYIVGRQSPLVVPAEIILAIRDRMEGDIVLPVPEEFREGERVFIKDGTFKDFYAIFSRDIPGKERAMILLEALHCAVDIERSSLKKVYQPSRWCCRHRA